MSFEERLKYSRELRGMTLKELGQKIGKTEATVQRYESGDIKNIKNDVIEMIADALDVSPAYLMGWTDKEPIDENTKRIAAHIDNNVTEEQMKDIIKYIEFLKSQHQEE
ncbi:helix-turn-helix transcriptional regulator [Globicatella sp. PHS-GS-PNBC-21-1553]|uniref:helix-turn-helix domain-containing protein n=1 Tax=Globicatella sp. PHS-GS-PNBC-21-1553 TaxID=2885764 RepID=UPI00298F167A|nr:helix-turn-helix transcriptional regulator [Globicatella sp. PHS-GS-PNBC-21-1553]WPC08786.1 helix-turn-helix domain-containing protein [Globicatella sp. PHS-GS-PNBC-21-1553]